MAGKISRSDWQLAFGNRGIHAARNQGRRRTSTPIPAASLKRRSKFGNIWTEYGGRKYASKREARYAAELDLRVKAGEIVSWRRQVKVPLRVGERLITNYIIDFEIRHTTGELEYIEVKGHPTADWLIKWKLFDALWPRLKKQIVR